MPRRREGIIHETVAQLETLMNHYQGTFEESRIHMLLAFLEDPKATIKDVARRIQHSERTIRRWWNWYTTKGIDGLLPDVGIATRYDPRKSPSVSNEPFVSPRVREFLNSLPTTRSTVDWIKAVCRGVRMLLGDVDKVVIDINLNCDPDDTEAEDIMVRQYIFSARKGQRGSTGVTTIQANRSPAQTLIEQAACRGFPIHKYQKAQYFEYYQNDNSYLGTIILWREKNKRPISQRTLEIMRSLEPFMTFLLSDCVMRRQQAEPNFQLFNQVADSIANQVQLTPREKEVFLQQIFGRSQDDIAVNLNIAVGTVRKHISSIYRKAGTNRYGELFIRFFGPKLED
jgi:DNA-binding CsgD family transcriptional regulator